MIYHPGQVVKYANPTSEDEADLRFSVLEDRETRLLVSLIGKDGLGLQNCFAKSEYMLAND